MGNTSSNDASTFKAFSRQDKNEIKTFYKDIASRNNKPYIDKEIFLRMFKLPGLLGERLFDVFDYNHDQRIHLKEFLTGLAIIIHGSKRQKIELLFKMYDLNEDGRISHEELTIMFSCTVYGGRAFSEQNGFHLYETDCICNDVDIYPRFIENLVSRAFISSNKNFRQTLSFEEFSDFVAKNSEIFDIVDYAFIFEDLIAERDRTSEKSSIAINKKMKGDVKERSFKRRFLYSGRENSLNISQHFSQRIFKVFLRNSFPTRFCGDIITPDSIKEKFRGKYKNSKERTKDLKVLKPLKEVIKSSEEPGEISLNFMHAFEQIHHFHHNVNLSGNLYQEKRELGGRISLNKRYLVLHDSFLYVFPEKGFKPLNTIWMEGCLVKPVEDGENPKLSKFGVKITSPCDSANKYTKVFFAKTKEEQQKWLKVLIEASETIDFESQYELEKIIWEGKKSKVFSCRSKESDENFAVKIICRKEMKELEREALRLELSVMRLVYHPNIVQAIRSFEDNENVYILMRYYKEGDLFAKIKKEGRLSERKTKSIMWGLFQGCRYIQKLGVAHRDLKPENVMLYEENEETRVAIGDFGMSCFIASLRGKRHPCGTLNYTAPEVLLGRKYNKEVDLWSLGVIMHLLLNGSFPYKGKDQFELMNDVLTKRLTFKNDSWHHISSSAKNLLGKLLRIEPRERIDIRNALCHEWFDDYLDKEQK